MNNKTNITKFQFSVMIILVLCFSVTGATYAFLAFSWSNDTTINGEAATVNLNLNVELMFPKKSNTGVLVPQLSVSGSNSSPLSIALKNGCVDGNSNLVCKVYKIVVNSSGSTIKQVVDGSISFYGDRNFTTDAGVVLPNLKWKLIESVDVSTPSNSVLGTNSDLVANFNKNLIADDVVLDVNGEKEYYLIIWLNETYSPQSVDVGKSFYAKVEFNASNGTGVTSLFTA